MTLTTVKRGLERTEVLTTAIAVAISTTLYVRSGHAYLARGVVGDLGGLALLTGVLTVRHRRLRHEAFACLAVIGVVLLARPEWPLRLSSGFWWSAVLTALATYLVARQRILSRRSR